MSELLDININDIIDTRAVKIGDHVYQVRRLGVGEELDLNENIKFLEIQSARIEKLREKSERTKSKSVKAKLLEEANEIADIVDASQRSHFGAYLKLFNDGGDGTKARELLSSLSLSGIVKLLSDIFPPRNSDMIEDVVKEVAEGSDGEE